VASTDDYLIDLLTDMAFVTPEQMADARGKADESGDGVVDTLVAAKALNRGQVAQAKAAHFGAEFVQIGGMRLGDDVLAAMPRHVAKKFNAVPIYSTEEGVTVALGDPSDLETIDSLQHTLGRHVNVVVASPDEIEAAIGKYYGRSDDSMSKMIQDITEGEVEVGRTGALGEDDGTAVDADAPIIKLVNSVIVDAYKMRASDIHLEPLEKRFRVRYRIDGVLHEMKSPPKRLQASIISRLKIMSNMSIAERRIPQDGRIQTNVGGKTIDLRVSCLPTNHGESIVMRILDKEGLKLGLAELGFFSDDQQTFERLISLPDGILLVTGPTGSGKTTTLYSCLNYINRPDRKIITVEDPVEYQLAGINQVQVSEIIGFTFAAALRSMLRQAPNIVMLGEIRDMETATIAINASLTGHLVFSTLHTNSAAGAVVRLAEMGVERFLIASTLRLAVAQRLVRKCCTHCVEPRPIRREEAAILAQPDLQGQDCFEPRGCLHCAGRGYMGRMGLFEMLPVDEQWSQAIAKGADEAALNELMRERGLPLLVHDAAEKLRSGSVTMNDVGSAVTIW
jgi:general secretion pathway protein E/type IV pilus assembly protein PilB